MKSKKLDNLTLRYTVKSHPYYEETNSKNFEAVQKALNDVGVYISLDNNELYISIMESSYLRNKNRNAGRRKKIISDPNAQEVLELHNGESLTMNRTWRYSDVIFMLQTMTDKEICEKIGMAPATYYRHKKDLKNSYYCKSLDQNKLTDKEYLEGVNGNLAF